MQAATSPVPAICISPAPEPEPIVEPFSPFPSQFSPPPEAGGDGYRPMLLSPPPTVSPRFHRPSSPLRPADAGSTGKGLEKERFQALLAATRERNTSTPAKKVPDLRKEIALKAHKSKQMERRAVFLSKLQAPPSPSATLLPKTPPESPAIFHYTLPSPGLVSPLALYEQLENLHAADGVAWPPLNPWVEQVDFRVPLGKRAKARRSPHTPAFNVSSRPPTLEQILARMRAREQAVKDENDNRRAPLPTFLRASEPANRALTVKAGTKSPPPSLDSLPPVSLNSPVSPELEVKVTRVPHSATKRSPTEITENNLAALDHRGRNGHNMVSVLRRRMLGANRSDLGVSGHEETEKKTKRHSAPAEFVKRERCGFSHPVLGLPGGF